MRDHVDGAGSSDPEGAVASPPAVLNCGERAGTHNLEPGHESIVPQQRGEDTKIMLAPKSCTDKGDCGAG
ncbi:hypothetical protein TSUKUMMB_21990 [Rhodococcus sp. no. 34]